MKYQRGFTLIEAIVVVAIIALITAAAATSLREFRKRAEANAMVQQLVELETAFREYRAYELTTTGWPHQTGPTRLYLDAVITNNTTAFANFSTYFSGDLGILNSALITSYEFNQSDPYRCSGNNFQSSGVNILLNPESVSQQNYSDLFVRMNSIVDGDDPVTGCGKIRIMTVAGNDLLYYNIASSTSSY